eukprot:13604785-Alexandrium_andersonii.AAC.1
MPRLSPSASEAPEGRALDAPASIDGEDVDSGIEGDDDMDQYAEEKRDDDDKSTAASKVASDKSAPSGLRMCQICLEMLPLASFPLKDGAP